MNALLILSAVFFVHQAQAATVYQDRIIPVGAPCFVDFYGTDVNATMIQDVTIAERSRWIRKGTFSVPEEVKYRSLRVTFPNKEWYEVTTGDLPAMKSKFLGLIQERCR